MKALEPWVVGPLETFLAESAARLTLLMTTSLPNEVRITPSAVPNAISPPLIVRLPDEVERIAPLAIVSCCVPRLIVPLALSP